MDAAQIGISAKVGNHLTLHLLYFNAMTLTTQHTVSLLRPDGSGKKSGLMRVGFAQLKKRFLTIHCDKLTPVIRRIDRKRECRVCQSFTQFGSDSACVPNFSSHCTQVTADQSAVVKESNHVRDVEVLRDAEKPSHAQPPKLSRPPVHLRVAIPQR